MRKLGIAFGVLMLGRLAFGQANPWYQTDFPPEEFQARWAKIFDKSALTPWPYFKACRKPTGC